MVLLKVPEVEIPFTAKPPVPVRLCTKLFETFALELPNNAIPKIVPPPEILDIVFPLTVELPDAPAFSVSTVIEPVSLVQLVKVLLLTDFVGPTIVLTPSLLIHPAIIVCR